ncbi:hypothetical protein LCGC14_1861390 [marine sediment metagenome]|uniref:Reverse transcriptase N-terminal domain-containing protein n=1 Tax=marine sediment metagenome TaxID=412755 RepID=A0A0F9G7I0_9ZZZZ
MADKAGALIDSAKQWKAIDWQKTRRQVRRLQMRIAKAVKEGRPGKVKSLQWLLTHSFNAKLLAVKRVTTNKGKKTPGIDGVLWKGARAKMRAAHRGLASTRIYSKTIESYLYPEEKWEETTSEHSHHVRQSNASVIQAGTCTGSGDNGR